MENQKKALTYALSALAILAVAMVAFYYFQNRFAGGGNFEEEAGEEIQKEEKSEFVGTYSPSDGPLEADGKRIAFFTVNPREDGGYLGSAKVDTIGANESFFFECVDVRIEEGEFFLSCRNQTQGSISLNGTWTRESGGILVDGKVMWMREGNLLLEQSRRLRLLP